MLYINPMSFNELLSEVYRYGGCSPNVAWLSCHICILNNGILSYSTLTVYFQFPFTSFTFLLIQSLFLSLGILSTPAPLCLVAIQVFQMNFAPGQHRDTFIPTPNDKPHIILNVFF